MLQRESFSYIDLYLFSNGVNTSRQKDDKKDHAIIRVLNEKVGAKCNFMNCASASEGFSVTTWLGDQEADCPISGGDNAIGTQITAASQKDHGKNPNLPSTTTQTSNIPTSTTNNYMADGEAASIHKLHPNIPRKNGTSPSNSPLSSSNPNAKILDDYLGRLDSSSDTRSATTTYSRSQPTGIFKIVTRTWQARKLNKIDVNNNFE